MFSDSFALAYQSPDSVNSSHFFAPNALLRWALPLCLLLMSLSLQAAKNDTLFTRYGKGIYHTCVIRHVKADMVAADSLVDLLIYQFRTDPDLLFDWAFKGLGNDQKLKERKEVQLHFKKTEYDGQSSIGTMWVDVEVPGVKTFHDVAVKSRILKSSVPNEQSRATMEVFYSNSLLKDAHGTLFVYKEANNTITIRMDMYVTFGWFFNIFITQRRYRNIVEWRARDFVNNLAVAFHAAS